ncbi:putative LPS biosynthesis protein WbpG [Nitrococcus mobilis Nb-231]|uniref:Putative LPS biosynthesis protein WbpG n=2 Tax=Nitrococcus mobilis TaxID=35797 RepID=A4BMH1_9GAMM|nr:putative LPS biosynthesis protein WbpG [Nitrococcus mobilis Nb-231]
MDSTDPDIVFDEHGVCNHCYRYDDQVRRRTFPAAERQGRLDALVARIKEQGKRKPYDCVIGVSGGVDSTYVAYLTKQLGLRPLAVHFDNGWDSEFAVANIEKTLDRLSIDLYTYVVDWEEFKDLQLSFLKASTPDGEVPTDHAIVALLYRMAAKYGVKHILLGTNVASEAIMPIKWGYGYSDYRYIKGVQRQFGSRKLKSYPHYTLPKLFEYMVLRRIKIVPILDYVDYRKEVAIKIIQDEFDWKDYGGKHHESVYTRFYQSYILPRKFNIDKRRAHNANLLLSGQITRSEALQGLEAPAYHEMAMQEELEYVIKKLGITEEEFERLMELPVQTFFDYSSNYKTLSQVKYFMGRRKAEKA